MIMSLIPYQPNEGREIVLRHRNAVVVRDPDSQRLDVRGSTCPTCHQPLSQGNSYERAYEMNDDHSYVDPNYFRMLNQGNHDFDAARPPASPIRSLPVASGGDSSRHTGPYVEDEPEDDHDGRRRSSASSGSRIRREALSPNYFKTFFVEERILGKGGKGVVLLVRHEIDGCQLGHFACKRVPVGDDHAWLEKVLIEVELLAKLSHPNLVSYRHVWLEDVRLSMFGPRVPCAFILQQYCNSGDLHQYVVGTAPMEATKEELKARMRRRSKGQPEPPQNLGGGSGQLSFDEIYSLFKDVTSGVAYLHAANYVHRDLKPSNCLLHREGGKLTCLISDFGEVQPKNMMRNSTGATGTISYCAPEVLKMDTLGRYGNFTTKSDMFSLGMILYFMCFNRLPYRSSNAIQEELEDIELLRAEIADWKGFQDERRERPDLPSKLYTLLKKLLALDPNERPSANEVLGAMKGETNIDNLKRPTERSASPALGLRGSRVEILDSPAGTPEPDSRKQRQGNRLLLRGESSSWSHIDTVEPDTEQSSSLSNGYDDNDNEDDNTFEQTRRNSMAISLVRNGIQVQHNSTEPGELTPRSPRLTMPTRPLLLEPRRSRFGQVKHRVEQGTRALCNAMGIEPAMLFYCLRLGLFLFKLVTLASPCWPMMPTLEVSVPLVLIAAIDLANSSNGGRRNRQVYISNTPSMGTSFVLLCLHMIVLSVARRWDSLCLATEHNEWDRW